MKEGDDNMPTKTNSVKRLQHYYNQRQAYNKEKGVQYFMLNNNDLAKLESRMTPQQKIILDKAFNILDDFNTAIYKSLQRMYYLDKAYGVDRPHYSETARKQTRQKYPNKDIV
jgi:hypothetical protein